MLIKRQRVAKRELWALRDVDIDVLPGESFGIVGQNGSGKSTLLKLIAGIYPPSEGDIRIDGRIGSLLEVGAGFHPDFSGIENVYLNAAVFGIKREYIDEHLDEIIAFAELEDFADQAVKTYSSGMYLRLGFSVAMHIQPDILLLDEVLAVGDEAFQQKCQGRIWDYKRAGGTIVFVSHDPTSVERLCDRAMLLEKGRVVESGTPEEVLRTYHRHLASRVATYIERPDTATPRRRRPDPGAARDLRRRHDPHPLHRGRARRARDRGARRDRRRERAVHARHPRRRRPADRGTNAPRRVAAGGHPRIAPPPPRGPALPRWRLPDRPEHRQP